MKTKYAILATFALILSAFHSPAVVDQTLQVQGTNLVLSWPSLGYEYYMIQYWPTLDAGTQWVQLTNCLPANSTNRTTYVIPCCALSALGGGSSAALFSGGGDGGASLLSLDSAASVAPSYPQALVDAVLAGQTNYFVEMRMPSVLVRTNGVRMFLPWKEVHGYLPLIKLRISERTRGKVLASLSQNILDSNSLFAANLADAEPDDTGGPLSLTSGGCDCPDKGFFRVWHIPDWLGSVTNHTFDGPTFIAVDFKDYMDRVENIQVLLDGQAISDAVFTSIDFQGQTYWGMGIYFDLFPSGTHQIQLLSTLRINDEIGDGTQYLVLSNLTRNIVVDNQVSFTNWDGLILSSNFTYQAQTKTNSTDWWIDIYDASDNYVNGGSGHTSNGQISWTWDLTDTLGNPRDDIDSDPFFSTHITFTTAAGAQATRRAPSPQTEYPATGNWLFSYLDRYYLDILGYPNVQDYYTNAINGMAGGPAYRGIPFSVYPLKFGTNAYTQQDRNDSWAGLKARLYDARYRNFYYKGHGNATEIGADIHTFGTNDDITGGRSLTGSKAYLQSQNISNEITFNRYGGSRPYRFVWLDGCSTANGNWPGAFGVDKASYDVDHYTNSTTNPKHRRPSAFVGWNRTVGFGGEWGGAQASFNFRTEWMTKWYLDWQTEGLYQAFKDARQSASWPPGGDSQLFDAMKVYGYTNLLMNGYNQKQDWRWP